MKDNQDLVRVAIVIGGVKSSVSMDGRLFHYMTLKLGDKDQVRNWVRDTVRRLEREWGENAERIAYGDQVRANTGISRAVQREVIDELMRDVVFAPPPREAGFENAGVPTSPAVHLQ